MPDVAIRHDEVRLPATLLAQCELAANAYAGAARAGTNPGEILVLASKALPERDLALITWAAHLGYREGLEVRS